MRAPRPGRVVGDARNARHGGTTRGEPDKGRGTTMAAASLAALAVAGCLNAPPGGVDPDGDGSGGDAGTGGEDGGSSPVLFASYPFEQPDPLADATGNGREARCPSEVCPTWIPDRQDANGAALFDGASQYLMSDPAAAGPFTVMSWLRMDDDADGGLACPLNLPFELAGVNSWQLCLSMGGGGDGVLYFFVADEPYEVVAAVALAPGDWHHVAIRWDGEVKSMFWDGDEVASGEGTTRFDDYSAIHFGTDTDAGVLVAYFPGALDQLEMWQGALTANEIRAAATGE